MGAGPSETPSGHAQEREMTTDVEGALRPAVGSARHVRVTCGGYEVVILEPTPFPWEDVFRILLAVGHDIWVTKEENRLVIASKPPPV